MRVNKYLGKRLNIYLNFQMIWGKHLDGCLHKELKTKTQSLISGQNYPFVLVKNMLRNEQILPRRIRNNRNIIA